MKIVHLLAGAGGMYCGTCLQGNTLARALREAGEDVLLVPVYTPPRTDEPSESIDRVVYGGINVYLEQHSALFRHTPRFLDRLLDNPRLLRWATKHGRGVHPERLGALSVSMLRGEEGRQRKELERLVDWLAGDIRPEVVHLSTVMLLGMARRLTEALAVPVVCTLSGEDSFLEKLPEPHYSEARAVLRERSADLAALVAMNHYYADFMAEYLPTPRERIRVIPPGLNLAGHGTREATETRPAAIGYLSRICPEKGLHHLADAFHLLAAREDLPPIRLLAAGYIDDADRTYLDEIESQLADRGLADRFQYVGELDRAGKIEFLQSLSVMSVPTVLPEAKGLPVLEAWANAVPAVLPDHGTFPELVQQTGGGLLCEPNNPAALAETLVKMISDPVLATECGRRAQAAIRERFHAPLMAQRTIDLYRELLSAHGPNSE
ncbi:MAG: glycosyltransferase family 4 protein [Planctomycetes bacterium]|nr:glycosyltransferase family 4 protein [Planctomycetota bacterium]